jgi:hypothetical protein
MAVLAKDFVVSMKPVNIDVNQPGYDPTKQGQLSFNYTEQNPNDLQQSILDQLSQQAQFGAQSQQQTVDVSTSPNVTPFPLGCPTGFYQQGNVCIPAIGTYPSQFDFNSAPGIGIIDSVTFDVINKQIGVPFNLICAMHTQGGSANQYFVSITIPAWNLTTDASPSVLVPGGTHAIIYKLLTPPTNSATTGQISGTCALMHNDPHTGVATQDATFPFTFNAPSPASSIVPPITPPSPPPWYQSCTPTACTSGAYFDIGSCQCLPFPNMTPTGGGTTTINNTYIVLSPGTQVLSDTDVDLDGYNFHPDEDVDIAVNIVLHGSTHEGEQIHLTGTSHCDHDGHHRARIHVPHIPDMTFATGILGCLGHISQHIASHALDIT